MWEASDFWAKVKKTEGCWEWQGSCNNTGYGTVRWRIKTYTAHRLAAFLLGLVDSPSAPLGHSANTHVLHKCDNRKCCNPDHFFLGSYSDNQTDCYSKGRANKHKGSSHANAKLSDQEVKEIRELYRRKVFVQTELAKLYSVSQRAISLIVTGRTYK